MKDVSSLQQVVTPCVDDHPIPPIKGELSDVCAHIVLRCLYLARIGRPDLLQSVHPSAKVSHKVEQNL